MGSMSIDCRSRMEIEATEEVVRFLTKDSLKNLVPEIEYNLQMGKLLEEWNFQKEVKYCCFWWLRISRLTCFR